MWTHNGASGVQSETIDLTDSPPRNDKKRRRQNSELQSVSSKKQAQWVSSAFDDFGDFADVSTSTQGQKAKNSSRSKNVTSKPDNPLQQAQQICRGAGIERGPPKNSKRRPQNDMELWSDKYAPKSQSDLAVHKKKISEVESWLQVHLTAKRKLPPIALLTGPAGVGKTATIKVLAKELKCDIKEWINPIATEYNKDFQNMSDFSKVEGYTSESQLSQFQQFLLRADKYNNLGIFGEESCSKKLILVEDFPNIFFRDASLFHDIIRKYSKVGSCPLIFIVSDSTSGESNERLLFPKDLQQQLHIENISFNPVALTSMTKVLTKIAQVESSQGTHKFTVPSRNVIESLAMSSAGDIRGAINALQFACLKDTGDLTWGSSVKENKKSIKKCSSKDNFKGKMSKEKSCETSASVESDLAAIGGRDTSLFLFRALGKVLYCKRGDPKSYTDLPVLPAHLSEHDRDPLLIVPEDVVEKSHLSGDYFSAYLHQNYLEFYSELSDVERAADYLSDSDNLTVEWASRSVLQQYAAAVATRGLIHSNSARARFSSGGSGLGWKPLHKPQWYSVMKQARQNCDSARCLFKNYAKPPEVLQTEILPYISLINTTLHNPGQIAFIQDICKFSSSRFPGRSEKLDEKDVVPEDSLETDQQQQSVSDLKKVDNELKSDDTITNSQSKVKTGAEEEGEEEEFVIEEFDD